jgi:hypothetical protein
MVAREVIVSVDDDSRRLVWTIVGGRDLRDGLARLLPPGTSIAA